MKFGKMGKLSLGQSVTSPCLGSSLLCETKPLCLLFESCFALYCYIVGSCYCGIVGVDPLRDRHDLALISKQSMPLIRPQSKHERRSTAPRMGIII